ncbi:MAG: selenium-binding family protein [Actinomycetota bacterium]|nr:selenium-binding family protein [Actinomycetota bacterium]
MMRLSPDAERLYVTNSVLRTLDNDPEFGPRNDQYGIWQFEVAGEGGLTSVTQDGSAWVDFTSVRKKHGVGPAGPHMILFDPGVPIRPGHH